MIRSEKQYLAQVKKDPQSALVRLSDYLKPFQQHIYYATADNFTKQVLYTQHGLFLNINAARQLAKVQDSLLHDGYNLLVFDGYRPYSVTKKMWEIVPDERYAANPAKGSGHNRGLAIDLSIVDAKTGEVISMPTGYDNFTDSAHYDFTNLPAEVLAHRTYLKNVMEAFGFEALSTEWWHFSLVVDSACPVYNLDFETLKRVPK